MGLSALPGSAKRSGAWHSARHSVARRAQGMSSVEQWGTAHDAQAAPVCRALLVAVLEKFYHSCSQGVRFIAAATVQGADDAPNVLRVPSSPPLLSAPLLQRAVSRQHAECGPQTRYHVADLKKKFWHEGAVCVPKFPPCLTAVSRGIGRGTCARGGIVLHTQSQHP